MGCICTAFAKAEFQQTIEKLHPIKAIYESVN